MKSFFLLMLIIIGINLIPVYSQEVNENAKTTKSDPNIPIFEIKNDLNQTVFAVYPGGVKIFIEEQLKAAGGGFTIGRLGTGKLTGDDYFVVNPGDVKVLIPETKEKAVGGGFTVGRLGTGKASGDLEFLRVTPDSTRIFVTDSVAGFAISNLGEKNTERLLNLSKQNYLIGHNAGYKITSGKYNSVFGYEAGKSLSTGDNNLFLGFQTGYNNAEGQDNIYIGNRSGFRRTGGYDNICIGNLAGENSPFATHSTFIGSEAGRNMAGDDNICIGDRSGTHAKLDYYETYGTTIVGIDAGRNITGDYNTIIGTGAGSEWSGDVAGSNNVFIGVGAGAGGGLNKLGSNNVCIGYNAGFSKPGDNKLFIANSDTQNPLIYGEFDTKKVNIGGQLSVNGEIISPSDIKLKSDLDVIENGIEIIRGLKAYHYRWNKLAVSSLGYNDNLQVGLIAQELELLLPELVHIAANGYKAIDYTKLVPVLVAAFNQQQALIEDISTKNSALEKKLDEMKILKQSFENQKSELNEMKLLYQELLKKLGEK